MVTNILQAIISIPVKEEGNRDKLLDVVNEVLSQCN